MMKNKTWLILLLSFAGVIIALAVALGFLAIKGMGISYGIYLEARNNTPMMIVDNSPMKMSRRSDRDIFDGLENGDRILVIHSSIAQSYPSQTGAYAVIKLWGGDASDISSDVIENLMSMGWITEGFEAEFTKPQGDFPIFTAYAGWSESDEIYTRALNTEKMAQSSQKHLPIYRLDTLADVEAFRSTFENHLAFEYSFDEVKSFNDTVETFADETYLKAYSLMVVYVQANSGTYRYGVESIFCDGENFTVEVEELKHPTEVTTDLAGWFIVIVVPDSMVNNCTAFDAIG